jgi:hypothetical protein
MPAFKRKGHLRRSGLDQNAALLQATASRLVGAICRHGRPAPRPTYEPVLMPRGVPVAAGHDHDGADF